MKKHFMIPHDIKGTVDSLSNDDAGLLFKALLQYNVVGVEPSNLPINVKCIFVMIKDSDPKRNRNFGAEKLKSEIDEFIPLAMRLKVLIEKNRNVTIPQSHIDSWARHMRLLSSVEGVDIKRQYKAMVWYEKNFSWKYCPVILSGQTWREKFLKLESAIRGKEVHGESKSWLKEVPSE